MEIVEVDHTAVPAGETLVTLQRRAYRVEAEIIRFDEIPNLFETTTGHASVGPKDER